MNQQRFFLGVAGVLGGLGVVAGSFGGHPVKDMLSEEMLVAYKSGVLYQLVHALAILAVASGRTDLWKSRWTAAACWAWTVGGIGFAGSLYILTLTGITFFGPLTPLSGLAMIAGWCFILVAAWTTARTADGQEAG